MKAKTGLSLQLTCHGMSEGTFLRWKAKSGGMTVSHAKRLTSLDDETVKLEQLQAERTLDETAMKELSSTNGQVRRDACFGCASAGRDQPLRTPGRPDHRGGWQDDPYRFSYPHGTERGQRLRDLANACRRFGCQRLFFLLRRKG
jgi:putative transposase